MWSNVLDCPSGSAKHRVAKPCCNTYSTHYIALLVVFPKSGSCVDWAERGCGAVQARGADAARAAGAINEAGSPHRAALTPAITGFSALATFAEENLECYELLLYMCI